MTEAEGRKANGAPRRRGRVLRVVLVVSLALNLLVAGVMAGGAIKGTQMHHTSTAPDLRSLWLAMPEEMRRDMRRAEGARAPERQALRDERRARTAARQEALVALLRAPEFDAQAFSDILIAEHEERSERIARAHQAFVARVSDLDMAERAAVADRLQEGRGRGFLRR